MEATASTIINPTITPAAAVEILAAGGLQISEKEAADVVDFLYTLAGSTIPGAE